MVFKPSLTRTLQQRANFRSSLSVFSNRRFNLLLLVLFTLFLLFSRYIAVSHASIDYNEDDHSNRNYDEENVCSFLVLHSVVVSRYFLFFFVVFLRFHLPLRLIYVSNVDIIICSLLCHSYIAAVCRLTLVEKLLSTTTASLERVHFASSSQRS